MTSCSSWMLRSVWDAALLWTLLLETTNPLSEPQEFPTASQTTIPILLPSKPATSHWYHKSKQKSQQAQGQKGGSRRGQLKNEANLQASHRPTHLKKNSWIRFHWLGNYINTVTAPSFHYLTQNLFSPYSTANTLKADISLVLLLPFHPFPPP